MKKLLLTALSITLLGVVSQAQNKKKQDVEAIKSMYGCFEVTFNFAETFSPDKDYKFHDNYKAGALEYVFPLEESKDKLVLQHLLIVSDSMIIKHWRQDWLYENTDLYLFNKDNTWNYVSKTPEEVKGQWTQKVYQVDDGPRYEGTATWVHADGKHYWENTTAAPLPRREFSKRKDYNVMGRRNRQEIVGNGWIHEQDNEKINRTDSGDELIAQEKGWNTYFKVSDEKCLVAKNWWASTEDYWADVRFVWDELFASKKTVAIQGKVDDKVLFMKLFALEGEMLEADKYDSDLAKTKIRATIQEYLKSDQKLASAK